MFLSTLRTLNILAAVVWYAGGIALVRKGVSLLIEAAELKPGLVWPWIAVVVAILFGSVEARFRFSKSCERNLARIAALEQPMIWQFFKPGFFVALAVMIAGGAALSRWAHNHYIFLLGVAALDLGIAIALLGSSYVYWREKAFSA